MLVDTAANSLIGVNKVSLRDAEGAGFEHRGQLDKQQDKQQDKLLLEGQPGGNSSSSELTTVEAGKGKQQQRRGSNSSGDTGDEEQEEEEVCIAAGGRVFCDSVGEGLRSRKPISCWLLLHDAPSGRAPLLLRLRLLCLPLQSQLLRTPLLLP
jgi:hypothetical protein